MLRHVLCVLALALCCCASSWAVETGTPERTVALKLTNGEAKITLTETVDDSSCTKQIAAAEGKSSDAVVTTAVTLKKKDESGKREDVPHESSLIVKVPDGYKLTLVTTLVAECAKKSEDASASTAISCQEAVGATSDTYTITYEATTKSTASGQTAANIPETENNNVKVQVGRDVKLVAKVVATCAAVSVTQSSTLPTKTITPGRGQGESPDGNGPGNTLTKTNTHLSKQNPNTAEPDILKTQGGQKPQQPNTPVGDSPTGVPESTGQDDAGEPGRGVSKGVTAPTSSEAESTEADNSVPVNDADHTAPTATPQSGTTTEGAPKTDAGMSTSAGEGVKLPDRNTDASSSSTAWVRAPLLLLLACVAVW
ncbi:hypothetical protein DQ04_10571020 [Trypanosoma grayi]|uniref:hypothetical protein n=1 Tax=Trypanosoma grayi TaxID=71804 RepID=UPI0004F4AC58|nr:hypothetical protein DQ04_10571020 [Trypanosoma grayi]KEG07204.1 hypothetical protein DQ04_10571020 [Trypanosoma grayi]